MSPIAFVRTTGQIGRRCEVPTVITLWQASPHTMAGTASGGTPSFLGTTFILIPAEWSVKVTFEIRAGKENTSSTVFDYGRFVTVWAILLWKSNVLLLNCCLKPYQPKIERVSNGYGKRVCAIQSVFERWETFFMEKCCQSDTSCIITKRVPYMHGSGIPFQTRFMLAFRK